ncbi:trefoil factor 2 [Cricetulus griseus]|uniref:Trefoil factor 2 n=1 Tax=Cricetulus griseus TaxID=10029 RepID=A0A9J7HAY9_CRIGR|nr:trefoil factor 2 [Cricetulus griseus]XP_035313011.1 trefoil factor 2 [Cricetulus griseus]
MGPRGASLLAVVLVLGLCALVESDKPSPCQCSRMAPVNRKNCGFPGITNGQCFDLGCCFDSSVGGVPWCYQPLPRQESDECVMEVSARQNCGYPGISPSECASRQCCFSSSISGVPWCFFPQSVKAQADWLASPSGLLLLPGGNPEVQD